MSEAGSDKIIDLAQSAEDSQKLSSALAVLEVRSAIRRREHIGDLSTTLANQALQILNAEARRMIQYPITSTTLERAAALVDRQQLRALDSIQLATAMGARDCLGEDDAILFIASDRKLLTAAAREGFDIWDPADQ